MEQSSIDPNLLHLARANREMAPTLMYQLQIDDIIIEIEHLLRGDVFDEKKEEWITPILYVFKIKSHYTIHQKLISMELKNEIRFDKVLDNGDIKEYYVSDPSSSEKIFDFLNENKEVEINSGEQKLIISTQSSFEKSTAFRHMNELGIKRISSVLKTYLNRNNFLTTYDEERILKKCCLCAINVATLFVLEGENYEMKEEEWDLILWEILMPNVESAICRATDSMTLNAHSKMQVVQERIDRGQEVKEIEQEQKKKYLFF